MPKTYKLTGMKYRALTGTLNYKKLLDSVEQQRQWEASKLLFDEANTERRSIRGEAGGTARTMIGAGYAPPQDLANMLASGNLDISKFTMPSDTGDGNIVPGTGGAILKVGKRYFKTESDITRLNSALTQTFRINQATGQDYEEIWPKISQAYGVRDSFQDLFATENPISVWQRIQNMFKGKGGVNPEGTMGEDEDYEEAKSILLDKGYTEEEADEYLRSNLR